MKTFVNGVTKFFVSNLAVVATIGLLPAFLFTEEVTAFNQVMNYLFSNES